MTKLYSVRAHVRRSPDRPPAYTATHRALIAYVREKRSRAAQARLDAALVQVATDIEAALEHALRGEMEVG